MAMNNLDKKSKAATNENLRRIYTATTNHSRMPQRRGRVKKHNCLNLRAKSEVTLNSASFASRPSTRRNQNATPDNPIPSRCFSSELTSVSEKMPFKPRPRAPSSRSTNSDAQSIHLLQLDLNENEAKNESPANSSRRKESVPCSPNNNLYDRQGSKLQRPQSNEDQEYLLFLLRITEDIISSDFYTNHDIRGILKTHIKLNKHRLNLKKMHQHIENLCKELNIECQGFEIPEQPDETDSPMKYQNSPNGHCYHLASEGFKNCEDCSVLRASSLYKLHSNGLVGESTILGLGTPVQSGVGDGSNFNPGLLRLLKKLSLGRVTECTESTSTVHSPHFNIPTIEEINNFQVDKDETSPVDFDTFVKELNATPITVDHSVENKNLIALESPPRELDNELCNILTTNLLLNPNYQDLVTKEEASNKSELELSEKQLRSSSEKYEYEFERISDSVTSENRIEVSDKEEVGTKEIEETEEKLIKSSQIPVLHKVSSKMLSDIIPPRTIEAYNLKEKLSSVRSSESENGLKEEMVTIEQSDIDLKCREAVKLQAKSEEAIPQAQEVVHYTQDIDSKCQEAVKVTDRSKGAILQASRSENLSPKKESALKVILQETVKEEDYVMIKGPVYVYKPLLNSEPQLIILSDQKSRKNSLDSEHSHKTFTVDHSHVLDQGIQHDGVEKSMENIYELTKTAYNQFMDMKLLQSDYDLTPEKDESHSKYHHLMVDATSSVSGMNIAESLLLSDDYLVADTNEIRGSESDQSIEKYRRFEPKMYENNYVIHRKLRSSVSMPKLKLGGVQVTSDTCTTGRSEEVRGVTVLKKCSSDLITFDLPSQDSSLRSEGETAHHYEVTKGGIAWNKYYS